MLISFTQFFCLKQGSWDENGMKGKMFQVIIFY